jgi:IS30 family transposase
MGYVHLSQDERYQIQCCKRGSFSLRTIANELDRNSSTISRELRRNTPEQGAYERKHAQRQSVIRRRVASSQPRIAVAFWVIVEARLREDWSPDQIAGHGDVAISHERIYQHIAEDRHQGGALWMHRRNRKHRRRHRCGTPRERQRFGERRIHERPPIVGQRGRVGDWEGDTIVGKGLTRLVTVVDRKSGLGRIRKAPDGESETVMRAILSAMYPLHARVHTLTWDNGSEFAGHALIDIALKAKSYFAMPYLPWQRGCNENFNGLVRQYVPKGCDIDAFSEEEIQHIEDKLNQRPRKRLGYNSPQHVFDKSFKRVALQS